MPKPPDLPKKTSLSPFDEVMNMLTECIHNVVETYDLKSSTIILTRKGRDYRVTVEPVVPDDDDMPDAN